MTEEPVTNSLSNVIVADEEQEMIAAIASIAS